MRYTIKKHPNGLFDVLDGDLMSARDIPTYEEAEAYVAERVKEDAIGELAALNIESATGNLMRRFNLTREEARRALREAL